MNAAYDLYVECCKVYGVKPNGDIVAQLGTSDLLHLRLLDASNTFLGRLGVLAVLSFVRQHQCIEEVRVPKNGVDEACMSLLADIIAGGHPCLRSVDVSSNNLSTASIRQVWTALQQNTRFIHLNVKDSGLSEEWVSRIQATLRSNAELEMQRYEPHGVPRSPQSWHSVFLLTLGTSDAVQEYCEKCLPVVNKYMAAVRVRVAVLTISDGDSADQVKSKVAQSQESCNYQLRWCIVLLGTTPFPKLQLSLLEQVLHQRPPSPSIEPGDRTGKLRARSYRAARAFFCYTSISWGASGSVTERVSPSQWLRSAGFTESESSALLRSAAVPPAVVLTPGNRVTRWQSDLFTSLQIVFRESPADQATSTTAQTDVVQELEESKLFYINIDEVNAIRSLMPCGRFHPRKTALVYEYTSGPYRDSGPPFILYGAGSIGKANILCNVASFLWEKQSTRDDKVPERVVCFVVDVNHNSVIIFLFRLLHLFAPNSSLVFTSVNTLAEAVRESICAYTGPSMAVLLGRIDLLDTCGCDCSVLAAWMPHTLPLAVRIVVSLNTESPVLPLLRKRMPQPFECLCPPMRELSSVQLFKEYLKGNDVMLPGVDTWELKSCDTLGISEKSYLQKEDAVTLLYPQLASSCLHHLLNTGRHVMSEYDTYQLIENALPPTAAELVQSLHERAVMLHPKITVESLLVLVALAPLPASELVYLCEELDSCPRHTSLSALLLLSSMGLLLWYQDATAHVAHPMLKTLFLELYREHVPRLSVLLESHLYRLVITYSDDVPYAFWHLIPLMIENGNMRQAAQLLSNPVVIDTILRRGPVHQLYVLAAFLRLLQAERLLYEVAALGGELVPKVMAEGLLVSCLCQVANCSSDLFQTALLRRSSSPYSRTDALSKCVTPQLYLRPLNDGQESTAVVATQTSETCISCHSRGGYVVAATSDSVFVFTSDLSKRIAELHMPFEQQQRITSVLLAAGSRVLVASEGQVLVWDYEGKSHFLFGNLRLDLRLAVLNTFGSLLVATSTITEQLCLVDVMMKRVLRELPDMEEGVRQLGFFCGNHLLLLCRCCLYLHDEEMKRYVTLTHEGLVTAVSCNRDGRVLVSFADKYLHVWASTGDLLHRIGLGSDPLVRLRMSASGAFFITQQGVGLQIWRTLTGASFSTLFNPFSDETHVEYFTFTEDSTKVVGRAGPYLIVWDAQRGSLIGAESAPQGLIQHVAVQDDTIFGTTTTGALLSWSLKQGLSSVDQVKGGRCTTNLLCNAKASTKSVHRVSTNRAGTLLVVVDALHYVRLYSLTTGAPIEHTIGRVRSAVAVGPNAVAFMPWEADSLSFYYRGWESQLGKRPLPRSALPDSDYELYVSPDEHYVGVTVLHHCHSSTLIYEVEASEAVSFELVGHTGRVIQVSFFGSFAFTVGETDACVRLWSLGRKAERTSYTHPCQLVAAAGNESGLLFCVDAQGTVVRLHVDNIVSVKHATLVVTNLALRASVPSVQASLVLQMFLYNDYLIMARANGELLLVDTLRDDIGHRVPYSDTKCACIGTVNGAPVLLTGHKSGKVILNSLLHTGVAERLCM